MILHKKNIELYLKSYEYISEDTKVNQVLEKKKRNLYLEVTTSNYSLFIKQYTSKIINPEMGNNSELMFYETLVNNYGLNTFNEIPKLFGLDTINHILIIEHIRINDSKLQIENLNKLFCPFLKVFHNLDKINLPKTRHWIFDIKETEVQNTNNVFLTKLLKNEMVKIVISQMAKNFNYTKLCHGDIKLENIIYQNNKLKIIDFECTGISDPFWDYACYIHTVIFNEIIKEKLDWAINELSQLRLLEISPLLIKTTISLFDFFTKDSKKKLLEFLGVVFLIRYYEWTVKDEKYAFESYIEKLTLDLLTTPETLFSYFFNE